MRDPDTDMRYGGGGEYAEIDPPNRLVFTWTWDDDRDQVRELIEIDFDEQDGITTVRFTATCGIRKRSAHIARAGTRRSTTSLAPSSGETAACDGGGIARGAAGRHTSHMTLAAAQDLERLVHREHGEPHSILGPMPPTAG